uniref:Uncharacterized protein n=1 Tax=Amphimedon queenslandica TaxID=400682 RepID=A0A1X7TL39_AMPQE
MAEKVSVMWLGAGLSEAKIDKINRKFIVNDNEKEELKDGQMVEVQLSRKKGSKAKAWKTEMVMLEKDKRARMPPKKAQGNTSSWRNI